MSPRFKTNVYNHLIALLFSAWLAYCSGRSASTEVTNTGSSQCAESERTALLRFKHGISVDNCGLLDSWGDGPDCCQWRGIQCNNRSGYVIGLRLPGIGDPNDNTHKACLEGTLNESLVELKHLKYLDLSLNHFQGRIPKFIGSISSLERLNLSNARFMGVVPQEIGNLSQLSSLDLNYAYGDSKLRVESLKWLSHLRLLKKLNLNYIDLSAATNTWLPIVNSLPFLQVLRLDGCELTLELPPSLSYINSSSTLNVVSLGGNKMNDTSIFKWLSKLKGLDTSLQYLYLFDNPMFGNNVSVTGPAIQFLGSLCNLQTLDLYDTNLYYDFSRIVQSFSKCPNKALGSLRLASNQVWGSIPDNINTLSSLSELYLSNNQLNGSISEALGGLSMLEELDLESNSLKGVVTGEHLSNLSKLSMLYLGDNTELVVNISANWIPPFQLDYLSLDNCTVGPNFPTWLTTQKYLRKIFLSNCGINSKILISFFNSLSSKLEILEMRDNMMYGVLPDASITFGSAAPIRIDLSSNKFQGAIPKFMRNVENLYLSNNRLSQGLAPFLCAHGKTPLAFLNLSYNSISDKLPDCWGNFDKLLYLHLENNKLWGNLPASIGALDQLNFLHLSNNNISGELPTSLVNCKSLAILDLSHNSLTGRIPSTFGYGFDNLRILTLQNNNFSGVLPSSLCRLFRVRILDFSNNLIRGPIPKCIYNLKAMADMGTAFEFDSKTNISDNTFFESLDNALIMWKRKERYLVGEFSVSKTKAIDFSNNKLEGHIPEGLSSLLGLVSINLSRNHLSGAIPSKISQLTSLEVFDLSHNHLSGKIPSLAKITNLEMLDLSYNNLSGRIPTGPQLQTFNSLSYMGNPELCGEPLPKCSGDEAATIPRNENNASPHDEHHLDDFMLGLYISVVLGLITGFWAVFGALALKRTWRHAFFRFYDDMKDKIYEVVVVRFARVWRRS